VKSFPPANAPDLQQLCIQGVDRPRRCLVALSEEILRRTADVVRQEGSFCARTRERANSLQENRQSVARSPCWTVLSGLQMQHEFAERVYIIPSRVLELRRSWQGWGNLRLLRVLDPRRTWVVAAAVSVSSTPITT
jgi:hypothetical protein